VQSRRSQGALGLAIALAVAWVMVPTAAVAANFTTYMTCTAPDVCTQGTTEPASGAGKVTLVGGGLVTAQAFVVTKEPGVTIDKIEATFNDGTKQTQPTGETEYVFFDPANTTKFVTRFEVFWNDTNTSTTTSSTSSTSSPSTSSTTSTSSPSTTSSSSTSTTTTSTTVPDPGTVVNVRPDGDVRSSPDAAAVRGYEPVDVVVRGSDDGFWFTHWDGQGWSVWKPIGTPPPGADGDPTIASWGPGRLDVFVRGNDGKLWQTFSDDYGEHWSDWLMPVPDGELVRWPEVSSRGPGLYDVFVLGTDGQVWQRYWDKDHWNEGWLGMGRPDVGISGEPATVSSDWNHVDIFVWGSDDRLYQRSWSGETGWLEWTNPQPDAIVRSSPDAASWDAGTLLVFVKGPNDNVYALTYGSGTWATEWDRIGGAGAVLFNGPGATSRGVNRFDVFVRGTDNKLYQIYQ
jgi:hypothetical protein